MSKQSVVESTNDAGSQPSEETGAQDDVDLLLKEYEESTETGGQPTTESDSSEGSYKVPPEVARILQRETQNDIKSAADAIKEATGLTHLPDQVFRGILHSSVEDDPRAMRLWQNRHNDRKGWEGYLKSVGRKFAKEMESIPDAITTSDRDAVEAAVRNASTHQSMPDEVDWSGMSDLDFQREKSKLARQARKSK